MAQSNFSQSIAAGATGQLALSGPQRILSCINSDVVELTAGLAVVIAPGVASGPNQVFGAKLPVDDTEKLLGIVMLETGRLPDTLEVSSPIAVVAQGVVYVSPIEDVAAGDPAFVVMSGPDAGKLTKHPGAGVAIPAKFLGDAPKNTIVALEINLP